MPEFRATSSVVSALTFGVFEFIFYWCVILTLAVVARRVTRIAKDGPPDSGVILPHGQKYTRAFLGWFTK